MSGPELRRPTRWERLAWRLTGRWPDSYVEARLAHAAEMEHRRLFPGEFKVPARGKGRDVTDRR